MKLIFIAFCVYIGSLFFRQQILPAEWLKAQIQARLPPSLVLHLGGCSFGFRHGLEFEDVKLYDRTRKDALSPMVTAERLEIDFLRRRVRAIGAYYDKLPDSYYEPGDYAYGPRSLMAMPPPPWDFRLPRIPKFKLIAERPYILGLKPQHVEGWVRIRPDRAEVNDIKVEWPRQSRLPMVCNGYIFFDIPTKRLKGETEGLCTQAFIRPHLVVLDVPVSLPYMDGFTGVENPVPAYFAWDVDLDTGHTILDLGLHPTLGFYNKVPMRRVDGTLKIEVWYEQGEMNLDVHVGPLTAMDPEGKLLEGGLIVHRRGKTCMVEFGAVSDLKLEHLLDIIDCLNDGTLDCFKCFKNPHMTVSGLLATDVADQRENDLHGEIACESCTLFGIPLVDAKTGYAYLGENIVFTNATARGTKGGDMEGWATLHVPGLDPEKATAELDVQYRRGSVEELGELFNFDLGDRKGRLEGAMHMTGPLNEDFFKRGNGYGYVQVQDGHLAQMKLFAGMTAALANTVPGVGTIVNQNTGACTYRIEDGVFKTDDLLIEGSLFSISAHGTYDIAQDNLDFTVQLQFTRQDSVLGFYLIRPILWPFTKLLMEYKVRGPIDAAEWDYRGMLDKVGL